MQAVEHDPYRFGLDIDEVSRRRRLVNDVGGEIESMRKELQETVHSGSALPNPADFDNVHNEGVDDYAEFEQQRQMEMMHEQDEQLDGVFKTVGNLRQQADDMGRELEEQAVMIDEVDTLTERVGGKLQNGVKRVGHIIRKNEGKSTQKVVLCINLLSLRHRLCIKLLYCSFDICAHPSPHLGHRALIL